MRNSWLIVGLIGFVLTLVCIAIEDLNSSISLAHTDFLALFYTAGTMIRLGQASGLYTPPAAQLLSATPFNMLAHQLLPTLEKEFLIVFLYPPTAALLFVPFTYLAPRVAFIAWQFISLFALFFSALIYKIKIKLDDSTALAEDSETKPTSLQDVPSVWILFLSTFITFLTAHIFLLGQPTIIFVFLPLVAGYVLWRNQSKMLAGIVWSILLLKTQIFIPIFLLSCASVFNKDNGRLRFTLPVSLLFGSVLIVVTTCLFVGITPFVLWFDSVRYFTQQFIGSGLDNRHIFAGSLPSVFNVFVSKQYLPIYTQVMNMLSLVFSLALFIGLIKVFRSSQAADVKLDLGIILTIGALPLISPYLRIYDLVLLVLLFWIWQYHSLPKYIKRSLGNFLLSAIILLNIHICTCTWMLGSRYYLAFALCVICIYYLLLCKNIVDVANGRSRQIE